MRHQYDELLTAPAAQTVGVAQLRPDSLRHLAQHTVADLVTMLVVDPFETVDIEEYQGQRKAIALAALDFVVRHLLELQPGPLPGQAIGVGQAFQLQVAVE
ncbi:hypothetical protein D9M68_788610 [compost metagenome]